MLKSIHITLGDLHLNTLENESLPNIVSVNTVSLHWKLSFDIINAVYQWNISFLRYKGKQKGQQKTYKVCIKLNVHILSRPPGTKWILQIHS